MPDYSKIADREVPAALAAAVQAHEDVCGRIAALEAQPGKRGCGAVWKVTKMRWGAAPDPGDALVGRCPTPRLSPS